MPSLPQFIDPMLARAGQPFDSPDHLFEVKWDGTRAISAVEAGGYRVHNRRRRDLKARYPELECLAALEPGVVLDGELVILGAGGKPEFRGMLEREQATQGLRIRRLAQAKPATYVVFDLLYRGFEPLLRLPLAERRAQLQEVLARIQGPRVLVSQGVVGSGCAFFEEIRRLELEGMVAKDLRSTYRPGERTGAWLKIKPVKRMHCAILGWQERPDGALRSVIVGAAPDGVLRCVGKVGSGLDEALAARLNAELVQRRCERPLVECGMPGHWVAAGLYCVVSYLEFTADGNLRAPVFEELIVDDS